MSDNIIREVLSALDTPATPPEDVAIILCKEIFFDSPDVDLVHKRATMLVEYADSIRKQCADRAVNDWFLNPRIDHNETTLKAAIMRKE